MKSRYVTILLALLVPLILVGVHFYQVRGCNGRAANGTAIWVPHLNMCAATVSENGDAYVLDLDTVCGSEEWDCQDIYRSPVTGEAVEFPDFVNVNLNPNNYPATFSPKLTRMLYVDRTEGMSDVHLYDLVNKTDVKIANAEAEASSVFGFEWAGEDQFSFKTLRYDALNPENFMADKLVYEWKDGDWQLASKEPVKGGKVSCNPIYCELIN